MSVVLDAKACLLGKERGERGARGRRGKKGNIVEGNIFEGMKGEEKGRYARTGGEEGDIWTDFSAAGDQFYWR